MARAVLPPIAPILLGLDPVMVGAAARLRLGGPPLHTRPELWLLADDAPDHDHLGAPDPGAPGARRVGEWRVRSVPAVELEAHLEARGISLDALAVRPDGRLLDPFGGLADLRADRLRLLGAEHLERRPSLYVQLPALASELALRLDGALCERLAADPGRVLKADRSALRAALTRLLVGKRPAGSLQLLLRLGVLPLVLPEVVGLVDLHRSSRHHHKDVWAHTKQVVRQAVPLPHIRWAALLHDVGKTFTRSYGPGPKVHFFHHEELGALMFEGVAARLRFPSVLSDKVHALIRHHLRANLYDGRWSDAAVRRFDQELGPLLPDLLRLSRADVTSKRRGRRREAILNLYELWSRVRAVRRADLARRPVVPKGLGRLIIDRLGVPPGPRVGELRRACEQAARGGLLAAAPDAEACLEWLQDHLGAGGG